MNDTTPGHSPDRTDQPSLIVIGNGMVGQRFLEELVHYQPNYRITVFSAEPWLAYDRVQLSQCFSGAGLHEITLTTKAFFKDSGIVLKCRQRIVHIDRRNYCVIDEDGARHAYDKLVIATGSVPFIPPIPGNDQPYCLPYRTVDDVRRIQECAQGSRSGVVIGGGLLGLEAARALLDLGLATHVVEFSPHLMSMQLDATGGQLLRRKIETLGISVHTSRMTNSITTGLRSRYRLRFADGDFMETDMIVFSAGIRACDTLGRNCGLAIGERGGIVIDAQCRSSDPDIYAIGEVASWAGSTYGLVAPGYDMARVCAAQLGGKTNTAFKGAEPATKLKLLGVDVASIGDAHGRTPGSINCVFEDALTGVYKKLVMTPDGKRLLGAVLVGDVSAFGILTQYFSNGVTLPDQPAALIAPVSGAEPLAGVDALPDTAQICSCNNVSKGQLCAAVAQGCTTMAELKASTRAATSCGGCATLTRQVLDAELSRQGIALDKSLCEHFAYSRQEIYHLVRVHEIRDFKNLLLRFGKGRGCDVCKPVIASVLASCWNDYVLTPDHAPLQDSNDAYLGNLQKDGTYSVVPRVPGGEITPEKLIVIGQVASKYDLYTKITGGQRIDLFGARVEQLPLIWRELVDAGFESGHAYGKAMRTVKSCVGSTWCRYGVQDSVAMAIRLENRYRGIRAPHKFKLAVSGCTRECAEAQSKDIGVIATEKGWNLYVCGNGGMRPRHAELLATDLDDTTLIRSIDRFVMLYIRTAERLQRTSTWREGLEGGLDYLKDVIMNDSLGMGAELEAQMQHLVDRYECEWNKTLNDPRALRRFRSVINDDAPDEHIVHVRERGQPRPANESERAAMHGELATTA
jgi:nitrite reductase (NADH) large subunit